MQSKEPYQITQKIGNNGNKIRVENKEQNYYDNKLKKYYVREDKTKSEIEMED